MSGNRFDTLVKIMPRRQLVIPSLLGAIGTGALTGLVLGIFGPTGSDQTAASFRPAVGSPAAAGSPTRTSATPTTSATVSASPTPTATVKIVTGSPDVPPTAFIDQPWNDPTMEFGTLEDVQRDGNGVTIQLRKATLLMGGAARRYLASQGQPPADLAVANPAAGTVQLVVRDDAAIFSQFDLGDHTNVNTQQLDPNGFYDAARTALENGVHPAMWVRHSYGIDSAPVIYLAEQYLP